MANERQGFSTLDRALKVRKTSRVEIQRVSKKSVLASIFIDRKQNVDVERKNSLMAPDSESLNSESLSYYYYCWAIIVRRNSKKDEMKTSDSIHQLSYLHRCSNRLWISLLTIDERFHINIYINILRLISSHDEMLNTILSHRNSRMEETTEKGLWKFSVIISHCLHAARDQRI